MRLITPNFWNFQRVLHTLAANQEDPRHTHLHSRGSTRVPPREAQRSPVSASYLELRDPFPYSSGKNSCCSRRILRGGALNRKVRGTLESCRHSKCPSDVTVHSRGTCFPCTAWTFKTRIDAHHCGTWDSPVGTPLGKATDPLIHATGSVTLLLELGRKAHVHVATRAED